MKLKIKTLNEAAFIPSYAHGPEEDAGMDLHSVERVWLKPRTPVLVSTGLSIELPSGFEAQIRPRSGLAAKYGITVLNSPGTIDPSYRGEVKVILMNLSLYDYEVKAGDRIAQIVFARYEPVELEEVDNLSSSTRGDGGFGSTGL